AGSEEEIYLDRAASRRGPGKPARRDEPAGFAVGARAEALLPERLTRGARARLRRPRWRRSRRTRTFLQLEDRRRTWPAVFGKRRERQALRELRNRVQARKHGRTHDRSVDSVPGRAGVERGREKFPREIGIRDRARSAQRRNPGAGECADVRSESGRSLLA